MIFYLAKVFKRREHADRFIRGEMYCNRLSWFKKLEERYGRGDKDEGAIVPQLMGLSVMLEARHPDTGKVIDRATPCRVSRHPQSWFPNGSTISMFSECSRHTPVTSNMSHLRAT